MKGNNGRNKAAWAALALIMVLLIAQNIYLYSRQGRETAPAGDGQWECAQTACSRLMTPEEIVSQVCALNDQQEFVCSLNVNGQQGFVALDALNLSSVRICAEFRCVKEVMTRDVDYPIEQGVVSQ